MSISRLALLVVVLALVATACGSQPETCDEVADQSIELAQDLIDDLEQEFAEHSLEDIIALFLADEEPPSVVKYEERAEELSTRAEELGCTEEQFREAVMARADRLSATTEIGEFIIEGIERGGL